jgi:hypothetical protein
MPSSPLDKKSEKMMVQLGPFTSLYSETILMDLFGPLDLSMREARALLRRLSVPTLQIKDIRFFDPLSLALALKTALRPGARDFFGCGTHSQREQLTRLSPSDISSNYRVALGHIAVSSALAAQPITDAQLISSLRKAGARLAKKVLDDNDLPPESTIADEANEEAAAAAPTDFAFFPPANGMALKPDYSPLPVNPPPAKPSR